MSKIVSKTLSHAMKLQEKRLAVATNNLANVATPGYRAIQVSFEQRGAEGSSLVSPVSPPSSVSSYLDLAGGSLVETGGPFDLAIEGRGFFVIETPGGTAYTRDGRFSLDVRKRLVTASGDPVMGENGGITIDGAGSSIEADGSIYANGQRAERLKVVDFREASRLQPVGENLLRYSGDDGDAVPAEGYAIRQGYREASNVDAMGEMTNLIDVQRSFAAYDKVKKMAGAASKRLVDVLAK